MNKKMIYLRNVVAIAICLAGVMMFSSCDKDENNGSGNASGDNDKRIVKIIGDDSMEILSYDNNGRITRISGDHYDYDISYSSGLIKFIFN